mgnify:CR=1 FL=1
MVEVCAFCEIATGKSSSHVVFEDDDLMVFVDNAPIRRGHLQIIPKEHFDYFIFGHRHLVLDKEVGENSRYINLGAWFKEPHFGVWDGQKFILNKFDFKQ